MEASGSSSYHRHHHLLLEREMVSTPAPISVNNPVADWLVLQIEAIDRATSNRMRHAFAPPPAPCIGARQDRDSIATIELRGRVALLRSGRRESSSHWFDSPAVLQLARALGVDARTDRRRSRHPSAIGQAPAEALRPSASVDRRRVGAQPPHRSWGPSRRARALLVEPCAAAVEALPVAFVIVTMSRWSGMDTRWPWRCSR